MKLSKEQKSLEKEILVRLEKAAEDVKDCIVDANDTISKLNDRIKEVTINYNDELDRIRVYRDEVVQELSDFIEEKSEKWQEGEKGQELIEIKDEWEGLDLDDLDELEVQEVEEQDLLHGEQFGDLKHPE